MANAILPIPEKLNGTTRMSVNEYESECARAASDPEGFWREKALQLIEWSRPFDRTVRSDLLKAEIEWFGGGELNVSVNCVDRHAKDHPDKVAILWEGNEPGEVRRITYRELLDEVRRTATLLRSLGIRAGDCVAIYLPMIPEAAFFMLACARIGAVHTVVFAGFSAESLRSRVVDCGCKVVVTANEGFRGPKIIPLKEIVDEALDGVEGVKHVIVVNRTSKDVPFLEGRDLQYSTALDRLAGRDDSVPEMVSSEHPLFILYTSGSTGKPKGLLHTTGGYLLYTAYTHLHVFDLRDDDVFFCTADVGWITGHSYVVYGPLANGATTVMFESVPTYPDAGRYWDMVERHRISILYTAPTAIRTLAREGNDFVHRYDRSSLRILGSVGEPINPDAWQWYFSVVGEGQCAVVDTWWQTETGGILISPLPGAIGPKPGSATLPLPGIHPVVLDEEGRELHGNGVSGRLCIKSPWPGMARSIYGDPKRFLDTYFSTYPGIYFTGDGCTRDEDGYYWITGRVDDVLNVAGHRLGTAEIEGAIVRSGLVAEAAVVGIPHDIKGQGIGAFCVLKHDIADGSDIPAGIRATVREVISPIASPDRLWFIPTLPKTRSGKIMRRILRKIGAGEYGAIGDTSTLADPQVAQEIIEIVKRSSSV